MPSPDRILVPNRLTRARAEVIWRLGRQGAMTQRELSQALRCTPRNVTGLVDALEGAELVARSPHPTDRRATLVILTNKGQAVARDWQAAAQGLGERLFAGLEATEPSRFVTTLEFVMGRLRDEDASSTT